WVGEIGLYGVGYLVGDTLDHALVTVDGQDVVAEQRQLQRDGLPEPPETEHRYLSFGRHLQQLPSSAPRVPRRRQPIRIVSNGQRNGEPCCRSARATASVSGP